MKLPIHKMAASRGRLILQCDWNSALRQQGEKSWITYKQAVPPSNYGELDSQGVSSNGVPYVVGSEGFIVQEVTKNSITVTYSDENTECTRKFVSPQICFSTIHTPGKSVTCVDASRGGLAVSADTRDNLLVWQTSNGEVRRELKGHLGDVYTCKFFPSGVVVLSGGADMQLKIWSAETGQCAATLTGHRAAIQDTAVVEKGRNVISCSKDGSARLWDVGQQSCLGVFPELGGEVNCCGVGTPEGVSLGQPDFPPSDREVMTEGKLLLLGCENKTFQGYGLHSRNKVFEVQAHDAVNCCCQLSDVSAVFGTQDGHVTIVDYRNIRVPLKEWKDTRGAVLSVCPVNQGFFLSAADGSCCFVDERYETCIELTGPDCDPAYQISYDGTHLFSCCRDGLIRKYNLSHTGLS